MICGPLRSGLAQYARFPEASPPQENPLANALAITSATILIPGSSPFQLSRRRCADMSGPSARAADTMNTAVKAARAARYNFLMPSNYASKIIEGKLMRTWLRFLVKLFWAKSLRKPAG